MAPLACPKCKTNEYTNRQLTLMINECGHSLCNNCVENLFARNSAPCPTCGRTLKKNAFWQQTFDDPAIEKENHVRKKLKRVYNLLQDDFASLRDYNDYLERFEQLVWNLTNDVHAQDTNVEIDKFRTENADAIERNRKRQGPDEQWVNALLDEERRAREQRQFAPDDLTMDSTERAAQIDARAIIEELKTSDLPAEVILDRQRKRQIEALLVEKEQMKQKKIRNESKKASETAAVSVFGAVRSVTGRRYKYQAVDMPLNGPPLSEACELAALGYLRYMRSSTEAQVAGGFPTETGCYRALQEARCDLLVF